MQKGHPEFNSPIILLHEVDGFVVTIETKTGEIYRGVLQGSEDTMNCELSNVTVTDSEGVESHMDSVYIRGSSILFIVVPEMFSNSPLFVGDDRKTHGHADGYAGNLRDKQFARQVYYQIMRNQ